MSRSLPEISFIVKIQMISDADLIIFKTFLPQLAREYRKISAAFKLPPTAVSVYSS